MKLTIEVEWNPMTTMSDNPAEPVRVAHQAVKFAAEDLVQRLEACQGLASITKLSMEEEK